MVMAGICMTKCIREVIVPVNPPFSNCTRMMVFADKRRKIVMSFTMLWMGSILNLTLRWKMSQIEFSIPNLLKWREIERSPFEFFISQTSSQYKHHATCYIMWTYLHAGFPIGFINKVVGNFRFSRCDRLIPKDFSETGDETPILRVRLPFCQKNENLSRTIFEEVTFVYRWIVQSFCNLEHEQNQGLISIER